MQHNEESVIKKVDSAEESTSSDGCSGIHPVPLPRTKVITAHDEVESVNSETKDESEHFESEDVSVKSVDEILDEGNNPFDEDTKSEDERCWTLFKLKYLNFTVLIFFCFVNVSTKY